MPTPDEIVRLRAEARRLRVESEEAFDRGDAAAGVAALERAMVREQAADIMADSTRQAPERTIRSMNVDTRGQSAAVKRGAGRSTRKHPAQRRLYQKGVTISALATELNETRARVSSWFAAGDGNRPIPRHHAEALRDRYGIPLGNWSRIAD